MSTRMTAPERRIDILRQLAVSSTGLRACEIVGCTEVTANQRIAEIMREGFVTEAPTGNPCSPRHRRSRYAISDAGRKALTNLEGVT